MVGDGTLGHMTLKLVLSCCSLTKSCPTLCDPVDCSRPGFPALYHLLELAQAYVHWVGDAIQPSRPLSFFIFLLSIFPSIKVFSKELALHIRWPKYWSFSISPSNEWIFRIISLRIDLFHFLAVQGTLKSLLQHDSSKASILRCSAFSMVQVVQMIKNLPAVQETYVQPVGQEDPPGERRCNPLQYSCLENPMGRGAWWATVHGVAKNQTQLRN